MRVIKLVLVAGLFLWLGATVLSREGWSDLSERASSLSFLWIGAACAAQFAAVLFGVSRWQHLLRCGGIRAPWTWLLRIFLQGRFIGAFTPSTLGLDMYRALTVTQRFDAPHDALRFVVAEKFLSLIALGIFAAPVIMLAPPLHNQVETIGGLIAFSTLSGLGLLYLGRAERLRFATRLLPTGLRQKVDRVLLGLSEARLSKASFGYTLVLSVASHMLTATVFVASALAVGIQVDEATLMFCGVASIVASLLPITFGGVGVREGLCLVILAPLGVSPAEVVLAGLMTFLTTQPPALAGGLSHLLARGKNIQDFRRTVAV
jgi:hypothetical protein